MAKEIEYKFLTKNDSWKSLELKSKEIKQGYLTATSKSAIRVRIIGEEAFLTVKLSTQNLLVRDEYEYQIPLEDGHEMLESCESIVHKIRHIHKVGDLYYEIDEFLGENKGLVLVEVEVKDANTVFDKLDFIGADVTHDIRYINANLAMLPYSKW